MLYEVITVGGDLVEAHLIGTDIVAAHKREVDCGLFKLANCAALATAPFGIAFLQERVNTLTGVLGHHVSGHHLAGILIGGLELLVNLPVEHLLASAHSDWRARSNRARKCEHLVVKRLRINHMID